LRCFKCDGPLEVVWRVQVGIGYSSLGAYSRVIVPLCERCAPERFRNWPSAPCTTCGRLVVQTRGGWWHKRARNFCCRECERLFYQAYNREKREAAREPRDCARCGERFWPARSDARYCKDACRQAAYRERRREEADAS
jgi:hypothetical protein